MRYTTRAGEIDLSLGFGVDGSVWLIVDRVIDGVIADSPDECELRFADETGFAAAMRGALEGLGLSEDDARRVASDYAAERWPPAPLHGPLAETWQPAWQRGNSE